MPLLKFCPQRDLMTLWKRVHSRYYAGEHETKRWGRLVLESGTIWDLNVKCFPKGS